MSVACIEGTANRSDETDLAFGRGIRNCDWDVAFTIQVQHLGLLPRIAAHLHGVLSCNLKGKVFIRRIKVLLD
ncbi:hypothetical protein CEXT_674681 [Caerostris extrusa]|uniref:Uncharacterized protein n=1 Tax=Caerostris extrusa TaxID=172846 RepID=A0AAV4XBX9_CAEEX|nr:hypothetical protein CEXT_674681 [Caerostris extrusa]